VPGAENLASPTLQGAATSRT